MSSKIEFNFNADDLSVIKAKVLDWLHTFSTFVCLDNNEYDYGPNRFELLVGAGVKEAIIEDWNIIDKVYGKEWIFGHINYEFKDIIYPNLKSSKDSDDNKLFQFFIPKIICYIPFDTNKLVIESSAENANHILNSILSFHPAKIQTVNVEIVKPFIMDTHQIEYEETVKAIQEDITDGNYYELNLCVSQCANGTINQPIELFKKLNQINAAPFAACYRSENQWLLSSSPERFMFRDKEGIVAQPMKGTCKRGNSLEEDEALKIALQTDEKECAENVMIVDLMRNDIAKCSEIGSVRVSELFKVLTFPTVYTMISTIEGTLKTGITFKQILQELFPMGSMTGAPKYIVMEAIQQYEKYPRGLYSGTVGYMMPNGDFDFNVVIRSIQYNELNHNIVLNTGSAITIDSVPSKEWEEVMLKSLALRKVLGDIN